MPETTPAIRLPIITSDQVCRFRMIRVIPTIIAIQNHNSPKEASLQRKNVAAKILNAVCIELLII